MSIASIERHLREELGLDPGALSRIAVRGTVRKRMRACGLETRAAYAEHVRNSPEEFERLANALVVHETSFFRYPAAFELLAAEARRQVAGGDPRPFRVSCVACSTGEEPASVVMALLDAGLEAEHIRVEASDVSQRAIDYAHEGLYRRRGVLRLPDALRRRWFEEEGDRFRLDPEVIACVRFRRANALDTAFGANEHRSDAVFCRNLLIYLVPDARDRLLRRLVRLVRAGGLLFVGHAEVPAVRALGLPMAAPPDAFACRATSTAPEPSLRSSIVRPSSGPPPNPRPPNPRSPSPRSPNPQPIVRESRAAPPSTKEPAQPEPSGERPLEQAARLANEGDLDRARRILSEVIAAGGATADHYHLLAVVEGARGRDVATADALRRALYLDPEHYAALVQLALWADAHGDGDRARRVRAKAERVRAGREAADGAETEGGRP